MITHYTEIILSLTYSSLYFYLNICRINVIIRHEMGLLQKYTYVMYVFLKIFEMVPILKFLNDYNHDITRNDDIQIKNEVIILR